MFAHAGFIYCSVGLKWHHSKIWLYRVQDKRHNGICRVQIRSLVKEIRIDPGPTDAYYSAELYEYSASS